MDRKEVCTTEFVPVRVAGETNCTCRHNESIERKNIEFSSPLPRTPPPPSPFLHTHTHIPTSLFPVQSFFVQTECQVLTPPTPSSAEAPIHRSCIRKNPAQTRTFRSFLFLQTECQVLEVSPTSLPLPLLSSLTQFRLFRFFLMSSRITCS